MIRPTLGILAAAVLATFTTLALGQFGPGDVPASRPSETTRRPVEVIDPTVDKERGEVSLPAEFWNEKLAAWIEVAVCGRPSEFLHETVVCITTTRTKMIGALQNAGFHDADAWVGNVADFPRIRGDRAMILLEVTRGGKTETYLLDEILTFQGWNVSIGPFGWMFKGDPEHELGGSTAGTQPAPATAPAGGDEASTRPLSPREQIIRDDPQIALQFRGLQHLSRSYIDHPLCYDDWIYSDFRYFRNTGLLPQEVYDSNGDVPVKLIIRKTTEADFLKAAAKHWHDPEYAKFILQQLPVAEQIDRDKAELWKTLPALRKRLADAQHLDATMPLKETEEFGKVALLAAAIEKGYTTLDAAWTTYSAEHAKPDIQEAAERAAFQEPLKLWREHMDAKRERAAQLYLAEQASTKVRQIKRQPESPEAKAALHRAQGEEIEARAQAMRIENREPREFWGKEKGQITPDDPRKEWIRHIQAQWTLAEAREAAAEKGIAFGKALQNGTEAEAAAAQRVYQRALLEATAARLQTQLADTEFEISKREGVENDPDLPRLIKQRGTLREQIKATEAALSAGAATQKQ